jgi:modulator of FtsH protease HflC
MSQVENGVPATTEPPSPSGGRRHGLATVAALTAAVVLVLAASVYTVDAREVAVVLSFGAPVRTVETPGLYAHLPWPIQDVVRFDRRSRVLAVPPAELLTKDKKNLVVEVFALWRVSDPQRFLESFRQPGASAVAWEELAKTAEVRLSDLVTSRIASALGQKDFGEFISVENAGQELLPADVARDVAQNAADRFGVEVVDVRLRHLGLPLQNEQSIYERMRAERLRIANAYRSEGEEKATGIRAQADRQAAEILAEADREAARVAAEADAAAARLYADAAKEDPEFYRYLRSLDASRAILAPEPAAGATATTAPASPRPVIVLDSHDDLFGTLTKEGGR